MIYIVIHNFNKIFLAFGCWTSELVDYGVESSMDLMDQKLIYL
jgi:hypothetical protein